VAENPCNTCGACCRGLEVDAGEFGDDVPAHLTKEDRLLGLVMRTRKGQCIALRGTIGVSTRCSIYEDRPQVCRDFSPGCELCLVSREKAGLKGLNS